LVPEAIPVFETGTSMRGQFAGGRVSLLEPFEDVILQWLFSLRGQGMPVSIGMVVLK
jgi:hypothetical protein